MRFFRFPVIAQVWARGSYEADDEDDSVGITLSYAYPDASYTEIDSKTWADFAHLTQTYRTTVILADAEDEPFSLKAELADIPTGVLGVQINSLCLSTTRMGQDPDNTGDGDGLIVPVCGEINVPPLTATQPGTWFTWLWANLNKFYRCELIKVINSIYTSVTGFFRTATWSIRWSQAAFTRAVTWLGSAVQWLNGHLSNIAVGQVTTITNGDESCGNLFCLVQSLIDGAFGYISDLLDLVQQFMGYLLDPNSPFWAVVQDIVDGVIEFFTDPDSPFWTTLNEVFDRVFGLIEEIARFFMNLINSIVSFLLTLAQIILALILLIVGQVLGLAGLARDVLASLVTAWNTATPTAIPGLPNCATYTHFWCKGVWVLDNTIYARTDMFTVAGPMEIIQAIMIGMGSISLILWVIKQFRKAILEIGGAI